MKNKIPDYLLSYGNMISYFQSQYEGLISIERGRKFLNLALRIIPLTEIGEIYEFPKVSKKESHDHGIDAIAKKKNTPSEKLYIQSKYVIKGVDEFDLIFSKFKNFEEKPHIDGQGSLFNQSRTNPFSHFLIITSSNLKRIIKKYETSERPSKEYYNLLVSEKRIHIIDGQEIQQTLIKSYRKLHELPSTIKLESTNGFLVNKNVYIGIISTKQLSELYKKFGDSLFLENIREYLGESSGKVSTDGRETVNSAIIETLKTEPAKFLARNNGITFRASKITPKKNNQIELKEASIVNGCQTTMSAVKFSNETSFVLTKIVEEENTWDIVKSANFQNPVNQIDLELAQYIRPQRVREIASQVGVAFENESVTPFDLINEIHRDRINYNSIKTLFVGFFSRNPSNSFENNYTEILPDLLNKFLGDENNQSVFEILFQISQYAEKYTLEIGNKLDSEKELQEIFKRFFEEGKFGYRSYISILTCCALANENIFKAKGKRNYEDTKAFFKLLQKSLDQSPEKFKKVFFMSFKVIAQDLLHSSESRDKILQYMYRNMKKANFETLFRKVRLENFEI